MTVSDTPLSSRPAWRRLLGTLYVQVLLGMVVGAVIGFTAPDIGVQLKVLGDTFVRLIKMMIGLIVFCTIVSGVGGSKDLKGAGKTGGVALLYFEVLSLVALLAGLAMVHLLKPGVGFGADRAHLDAHAVAAYTTGAKAHDGLVGFLTGMVPDSVVGAFANGEILQVVLISVLFGAVLAQTGERGAAVRDLIESANSVVFGVINLIMRLAPFGAGGAMAYTVGKFGLSALGKLAGLVGTFYAAGALFVLIALGLIMATTGLSILKLLGYLKAELLITLGASSSDAALPGLMEKMEHLGLSRQHVGLVVPAGYVFNTDGTAIYMSITALFIAQALGIDLTWQQEAQMLAVAMVTSKGAGGVSGAGFIGLLATLAVVPAIPPAGMALVLGVDRFMSEARALVNMIGNAVACVVLGHWLGDLDRSRAARVLAGDEDLRFVAGGNRE
ncbi:C4-dicarboxylate transporter DctA [Novosphingobium terrae]|uniref:C4-dicarboxylate transporter DctA n=1 Tax=Novosphingobium terrae TaxID=2726189 RepID=UPI00197EBC1A|nr:C4-dicarboxylate transporter DctA [Novosphingobium terrae]